MAPGVAFFGGVGGGCFGGFVVVDADEVDAGGAGVSFELGEDGHLLAAGRAPGGPEMDEGWLAGEVGVADGLAFEVGEGELGQGLVGVGGEWFAVVELDGVDLSEVRRRGEREIGIGGKIVERVVGVGGERESIVAGAEGGLAEVVGGASFIAENYESIGVDEELAGEGIRGLIFAFELNDSAMDEARAVSDGFVGQKGGRATEAHEVFGASEFGVAQIGMSHHEDVAAGAHVENVASQR